MNQILLLLLIILSFALTAKGQDNILFEREVGVNPKSIYSGLISLQTEIQLHANDTARHIFNLYFKSNGQFKWRNHIKGLSPENNFYDKYNEIIITAVPIIPPGQNLKLIEINAGDLLKSSLISNVELLKRAGAAFFADLNRRQYSMPPLNSLSYGLIIKENGKYFKVNMPVMVSFNYVSEDFQYYPLQYNSGSLSARGLGTKTFRRSDFDGYLKAASGYGTDIRFNVAYRTYPSKVIADNEFSDLIYLYWEFQPYTEVQVPKDRPQELPGLGSFYFLRNVGVINCTMDHFFHKKIKVDQTPTLIIDRINYVDLKAFQKEHRSKKGRL
ncbi:MAG: hypothetical protein EOO43_17505 [Flavobacterium sp.]|nr:MAG: hypothetical protein EOO43_17505 [Flavobacterium sp.]